MPNTSTFQRQSPEYGLLPFQSWCSDRSGSVEPPRREWRCWFGLVDITDPPLHSGKSEWRKNPTSQLTLVKEKISMCLVPNFSRAFQGLSFVSLVLKLLCVWWSLSTWAERRWWFGTGRWHRFSLLPLFNESNQTKNRVAWVSLGTERVGRGTQNLQPRWLVRGAFYSTRLVCEDCKKHLLCLMNRH